MKHLLFFLFMSCCVGQLFGQGTVKISSGATVKITGGAYLVLDSMHLVNNATLQQNGTGAVKFTGAMDVNISGSSTPALDRLLLSKAPGSSLNLQSNMTVAAEVNFQGGLLNLGDNNIDLITTGMLTGESDGSRAFTTGSGYIQRTGTLIAPSTSVNLGNLGAVISTAKSLGTTTIRRGHAIQQVLSGNYSIQRYYDINPTNNRTLNATLLFQYFDAELNSLSEAALTLWRSAGSSWNNLGVNSRDVSANYIEKRNVQNFARMTLALASVCPTITATIPDVYVVRPGGAANTLYIGYGPASVTLEASVSGGSTPYIYRWTQDAPTGTTLSTITTLTVSPTATTTYYLSVSDANGCSAPVVSKTINVVDVRCGAQLDMVMVCVKQKGTYSTQCITTNKVKGYLNSGSYLGACQPAIAAVTKQSEPLTEEVSSLTVSVSPNPAPNYFTLIISSKSIEPVSISVTDAVGRSMEVIQNVAPNRSINIGNNYRPGLYHAEVIQGKDRVVVKMIRQ